VTPKATRKTTNVPFSDELPRLLSERSMSIRTLARRVGVSPSHISRVVRRKDYKTPSPELMRKIGEALDLPHDYFPEYRESTVIDRVRADHMFRDELYDRLKREHPSRTRARRTR